MGTMFFRRPQPTEPSFEDRLNALRQLGFEVQPQADGRVLASRDGCAAIVAGGRVERAGWVLRGSIAQLVDGGYQKFWAVDGRRAAPALASQLKALHAFEEDLLEALGLKSYYNTSLGTTNDLHVYDRLEGRG
jgi:hypothetical protein